MPMCNDEQLDSRVSDAYNASDSAGGLPAEKSQSRGSKSASPVMIVDVVIFFISLFFAQLLYKLLCTTATDNNIDDHFAHW